MVSSKKTMRLNNFLKKIQTYIYIFLFSQSLRKPSGLAPCFAQPALSLVRASGSVNRPAVVSLRHSGSQRLPSHKQIQHKRLCLPPLLRKPARLRYRSGVRLAP